MGLRSFVDPTLDDIAERPRLHFFGEHRLTDGRVNALLATAGPALVFTAIVGWAAWPWGVIGLLMLVQLWRNWRRFEERLFFALAERDREGVVPPVHPDTHDDG